MLRTKTSSGKMYMLSPPRQLGSLSGAIHCGHKRVQLNHLNQCLPISFVENMGYPVEFYLGLWVMHTEHLVQPHSLLVIMVQNKSKNCTFTYHDLEM